MKKLICVQTGKKTLIDEMVPDYELDDVLDTAANRLLKRESDHKHDFICVSQNIMSAEICHSLTELTEHTGRYRTFKIV